MFTRASAQFSGPSVFAETFGSTCVRGAGSGGDPFRAAKAVPVGIYTSISNKATDICYR